MSIMYSPKAVTNGLVFCIDAANVKSYVSGSSNWSDLTQTAHTSFQRTTRWFNSATLQFSASYATSSVVVLPVANLSPFTYEAVAKTDDCAAWETVIGTQGSLRQIGFNTTNFYGGGNGGGGNLFLNGNGGVSIVAGQWYHLAMTYDGFGALLYKNGVQTNSGSIGTNGVNNGSINIASYNSAGAEMLSGSIGYARIYNRVLSSNEIAQNFNAIRGRFGI